jgi:thiol-disulfide isomerase/thioredoxin
VKGRILSEAAVSIALASALCATGCASTGAPAGAKTTVMSLANLDCSDCGERVARELIDEDGVYKTAFDQRRVELMVVADPSVDARALAEAKRASDDEWVVIPGPGHGAYVGWTDAPKGADVQQVTTDGHDVPSLEPYLERGKITIVDFSAKWCEPCRRMDAHVMDLLSKRSDIAYRKLDVGDWDTPLAAHWLAGVKELPHALVFDERGAQVAVIDGLDLDALDRAVERAPR